MSGRRDRRDRRSAEKRDRSDSIEDSSIPINSTDIPEDVIQDSNLPQEPIVTAAAASTKQRSPDKSSDSDSDTNSDNSDLIRRKIYLSTQKKREQEESD